ncbi:ANTAR domain-containing protein [Streptomyces sp. NPDC006333]|uniref:ANTAR domain-containing protein n=1 Tax=Streptomyces sp. NPDC006333 TaxID=3156753 RepID=UPI0033ADE149
MDASAAAGCPQTEAERLRRENRQLRQALASHATVDQAIGVLAVLGRIAPQDGFTVLREVSQHTNTKLAQVAEHVLKYAQGVAPPDALVKKLQEAVGRHHTSPHRTAPGRTGPHRE